tara:strand:+ start:829 stop:1080 length:252 start_codon:yes stop_codon:yes gene_type:complete
MENTKPRKWREILDNILIFNTFIIIFGSIFLAVSFILSLNGTSSLFSLFQKLWFPLFIPSLSLFFTAILVEAVLNRLKKNKNL